MKTWKEVIGFNGYFISNHGDVKSYRVCENGRILKPQNTGQGYLSYSLRKNGETHPFSAHRLVAIHFVDNALNKERVNHIDGDKTNNHANNLEWVTIKENMSHAYENGLINQSGENNANATLTENDVLQIRSLGYHGWFTYAEISDAYGVSITSVWRIIKRKRWANI